MTRLEEARWLAQELYNFYKNHYAQGDCDLMLVDDYIKGHDVEWISK